MPTTTGHLLLRSTYQLSRAYKTFRRCLPKFRVNKHDKKRNRPSCRSGLMLMSWGATMYRQGSCCTEASHLQNIDREGTVKDIESAMWNQQETSLRGGTSGMR